MHTIISVSQDRQVDVWQGDGPKSAMTAMRRIWTTNTIHPGTVIRNVREWGVPFQVVNVA